MVARFNAVKLFIFVNTTTAFYFATECSDVTGFLRYVRDPVLVPRMEYRVPRIRENYQGKYLWNL